MENTDTSDEFSIEWFLESKILLSLVVCLEEMKWSLLSLLNNNEGLFKGFLNLISYSSILNDKVVTSWIMTSSFLKINCAFLPKEVILFEAK